MQGQTAPAATDRKSRMPGTPAIVIIGLLLIIPSFLIANWYANYLHDQRVEFLMARDAKIEECRDQATSETTRKACDRIDAEGYLLNAYPGYAEMHRFVVGFAIWAIVALVFWLGCWYWIDRQRRRSI